MSKTLALVEDLVTRINGRSEEALNKILYTSLVSATQQIMESLRTRSFDRTLGAVEEFIVDEDTANRRHRFIPFLLNNGFVDNTTTPLSLKYTTDPNTFDETPSVDPKYLKINTEKGIVLLDTLGAMRGYYGSSTSIKVSQYYYEITYDYGFTHKTIPEGLIYEGVPTWLQEATLLLGREMYQSINPSKNDPPPNKNMLHHMVSQHYRAYPSAITAIL